MSDIEQRDRKNEQLARVEELKRIAGGLVTKLAELQEEIDPDGKDDGGFSLTLLVGGALVSGTVISAARFYELLRSSFGVSETTSETAKQAVSDTLTFLRRGHDANAEMDKLDDGKPLAVHLRNTAIVLGSSSPVTIDAPGLFRLVIARIDGATIGKIGPRARK